MKLALLLTAILVCASAMAQTKGTYLESRTCSVYVGACHFNGEYDTAGREAALAWKFDTGRFAGRAAAAIVVSDANLAEGIARKSWLYFERTGDADADDAFGRELSAQFSNVLGKSVVVSHQPVRYSDDGEVVKVSVGDKGQIVSLDISRVTKPCCPMPHEVWYQPLSNISSVSVGLANQNRCSVQELALSWQRPLENSAFIGEFRY